MATPKIVQRQLEQAEAALAASMQPVTAVENVVTDVSQLAAPVPAPAPEPAPAPAPTPAAPVTDWEQKFRTLQGMYNAEVPTLRAKEKTMESDIAALKAQVLALTEAKRAEPAKLTVDPKDAESFGADMIDMVQRYTTQVLNGFRDELTGKLTQFESRVGALEQTINGVAQQSAKTAEEQFFILLTRLVPDWKNINASQEFLDWLGEVDEIYGAPRQAALDAAHKRLDADRVAAVFTKFKSTRPAKPSDALANQVAPASSGGSAPPPPAEAAPRTITQKAVNQFYNDQAKGRYRGREEEAARIEAEINLAAAQGRIV